MKHFVGLHDTGNLLTAYRNRIYLLSAAKSQLQIFDQISEAIRKYSIVNVKNIESIESIHVINEYAWIIVRRLNDQLVISVIQLCHKFADYLAGSPLDDALFVLETNKNTSTIPIGNDDQYRVTKLRYSVIYI
jgi:hypothetical protein